VRITRFLVGACAGVALGVALLLVGGITWTPPAPACPGCAVLNPDLAQRCPGGAEAVQGGVICP
jgi:hypothetical protein